MKKTLILFLLVIVFSGCSADINLKENYTTNNETNSSTNNNKNEVYTKKEAKFSASDNNRLINNLGTEYSLLAHEGRLNFLGELEFVGGVEGESKTLNHLDSSFRTGLYKIKGAKTDNILIKVSPDSEWFNIYRKSTLQEFDFSVKNCSRFELVSGIGNSSENMIHKNCNDGITDKNEINNFLTDVMSQKSPKEAGLRNLVIQPDGTFKNYYVCGVIYGFFEEEPDLVVRMQVWSYNDLAYSVSINDKEYVLPDKWITKLKAS